MYNRLLKLFRQGSRAVLALSFLAAASHSSAQMVDLNDNGMSDIWEGIYGGVGTLDPNADADGDGASNLQESIAGTNPFDSNSVPKISAIIHSATNVSVSMPCAWGKKYQLQSTAALLGGSLTVWSNETSMVARSGVLATLAAPVTKAPKYFRIVVSDVD
ncbi:MAG TPA: thrombospondin type 3 repeat-containing protein, partial [Verrucomicrobiae bacterium]|nr:thrombospondin type 3 repeat-containing protein [Verrucomicrobiae bacterium]